MISLIFSIVLILLRAWKKQDDTSPWQSFTSQGTRSKRPGSDPSLLPVSPVSRTLNLFHLWTIPIHLVSLGMVILSYVWRITLLTPYKLKLQVLITGQVWDIAWTVSFSSTFLLHCYTPYLLYMLHNLWVEIWASAGVGFPVTACIQTRCPLFDASPGWQLPSNHAIIALPIIR